MKGIFQLSIPAKLIITVLVPMSLLVYLSFDKIDSSKERLRDLESIQNKTNEIEYISGMLHEIQKERDFASLYLMDASTEAQINFQNQIRETDSTFSVFKLQIIENESDTSVFAFSDDLKNYRGQISWFQVSSQEAFYYYNRLIENYLGQISLMGAGSKIPETRTEINAYISLLWTKEYLGRVRTVLNTVFTNGKLTGLEQYGLFATYKGGFESSMQSFQKIAATEVKDEFNMDFQMSAHRMLQTIDFVFEHPEMERFPYEADEWWFTSTSPINVLYQVEQSSISRINGIVLKNIVTTQKEIDKTLLVLSGSVFIALLLSILLIRSMTRQLNAIRSGAIQIAEGNNDVLIENPSSDAIGTLAKGFNSIAENARQLAKAAECIGNGDYDVQVPVRGMKDQLGIAIDEMRINLNEQTRELVDKAEELQKQNDQIQVQQSELENKVEELAQANRFKSAFLANMSHELKTPLNSLIILTKVLHSNENNNLTEDQLSSLSLIAKSGDDLIELINDILDISKIEAGRLDLNIAQVSLKSFVNDLNDLFAPVANQNNIRFNINYNIDDKACMDTDSLRLGQALKNLLSNSFKFTSENGLISLNVSQNAEQVVLSVQDNGIGIPKDKQKVIFEAFKQVDGSISRNYGGTGLGLSISKQLCDLLGAKLTLESEEGKGSTFSVVFPIASLQTNQETPEVSLFKKPIEQIKQEDVVVIETEVKDDFINNDSVNNIQNFNDREVIFLESDITRVFELSAGLNPHGLNVSEVETLEELQEKLNNSNPFGLIISLKDINLHLEEVYKLIESCKVPIMIIAPSNKPKRTFSKPVAWLNETVNVSSIIKVLKQK